MVSAPSGSGKSTLVHALLKQNLPLAFSISATSRSPRGKEKDGVDYHFLTPEAFQKKIAENAVRCASELLPNLPIYFASDNPLVLDVPSLLQSSSMGNR